MNKRQDIGFSFKHEKILYWLLTNWVSSNFDEDKVFEQWHIRLK